MKAVFWILSIVCALLFLAECAVTYVPPKPVWSIVFEIVVGGAVFVFAILALLAKHKRPAGK